MGALLLFGGDALYDVLFTLFAGILVGTVPSITVASTVQELLNLTPLAYQQKSDLSLVNQARLTGPQRTGPQQPLAGAFSIPLPNLSPPFCRPLTSN